MQDLTPRPVRWHLLTTTGGMLVTIVFQTLYFLVDLYGIGQLGTAAVAAVGIVGSLSCVVLALLQMLGVGATTAVSHASGRRDREAVLLAWVESREPAPWFAAPLALLCAGCGLVGVAFHESSRVALAAVATIVPWQLVTVVRAWRWNPHTERR